MADANDQCYAMLSLQSCLTLCDPIDGSPPGSWDSPGKNTGVGCHFLLQCMKVKSKGKSLSLGTEKFYLMLPGIIDNYLSKVHENEKNLIFKA